VDRVSLCLTKRAVSRGEALNTAGSGSPLWFDPTGKNRSNIAGDRHVRFCLSDPAAGSGRVTTGEPANISTPPGNRLAPIAEGQARRQAYRSATRGWKAGANSMAAMK
jgi:hypothetical protein